MSKSIYETSVKILNDYRNQNYNSTFRDEVELASAIDVILPKCLKQEELLELYKELSNYVDEQTYAHELPEITTLKIKIKELENEK